MNAYKEKINLLCQARNGETLLNGNEDQAHLIIEKLFSIAENEISILSRNLNARIYGPKAVTEQARLFLAHPPRKMRILLEERDEIMLEHHPLLQATKNNKRVEIRFLPKDFSDKDFKSSFCIVDKKSWRLQHDKNDTLSIASFGDNDLSERLNLVFNKLWNMASKT